MISGSAKNGRAILIISANPSSISLSAVTGELIRLVVQRGIEMLPRIFFVTQENAPRGTMVPIVGIRASCQPIPVWLGLGLGLGLVRVRVRVRVGYSIDIDKKR